MPRATVIPFSMLAASLSACGPRPVTLAPEAGACLVGSPRPAMDTIRIALSGPVDPSQAPSPATDAERLLFPQVYQTLLVADCQGNLRPGLATTWSRNDALHWTVRLRPGLRFWDGTPVTAHDVVQSLRRRGDEAGMLRDHGLATARAQDDSTVLLTMARPQDHLRTLADPLFAVVRDTGKTWPLGTGRYAIVDRSVPPFLAVPLESSPRDALPVLEFLGTRDPRDALDIGADLLITGDPTALEYARANPSLQTVPLPWDRTYVLLLPAPVTGPPPADLGPQIASAVRADARPAEPPFWWTTATRCDADPGTPPAPVVSTTARIAYPRDDPTATLLAQRLVALGTAGFLADILTGVPPGARLVAVGMDDGTFAGAVSTGREAGYVLPLPRQPLDPCVAHAAVFHRSPWAYAADPARHVLPLVDTRRHAVLRRGRVGVRIGLDGTVYLNTR